MGQCCGSLDAIYNRNYEGKYKSLEEMLCKDPWLGKGTDDDTTTTYTLQPTADKRVYGVQGNGQSMYKLIVGNNRLKLKQKHHEDEEEDGEMPTEVEARINPTILEWKANGRLFDVWCRQPSDKEDAEGKKVKRYYRLKAKEQERMRAIKKEFERLDKFETGFLSFDRVGMQRWEYKPGGQQMNKKERRKAKASLEKFFSKLKHELMNYEEFTQWADLFFTELKDIRSYEVGRKGKGGKNTDFQRQKKLQDLRTEDKRQVSQIFTKFDQDQDQFLNFKECSDLVWATNERRDDRVWGKTSYKRLCRKLCVEHGVPVDGTFGLDVTALTHWYTDEESGGLEELKEDYQKIFPQAANEKYETPITFQVNVRKGVNVREGVDARSKVIAKLKIETYLRVKEKQGDKVRICQYTYGGKTENVDGWVTLVNSKKYTLLKRVGQR